jgi:(p)ppGpp synthase/HD superfamily hydrolase
MNLIEQAMSFATQRHVLDNHQLYGQLVPYTHHLSAVEQVLLRFGFVDEEIRTAAWLHDVVEDTRGRSNEVKIRDIEERFGEDVAKLVGAVTSEEGPNRKIRNALTYPKIREVGYRAVALKLADRIANVEFGGKASSMYKKEHPEFLHGIGVAPAEKFNASEIWAMAKHLNELLGLS